MAESRKLTGGALREHREALVREHMESENTHDFDTTIGTFSHPRYELIATGEVYDGEREVRDNYAETRAAFPDQRNELISLRHSDDAVTLVVRPAGHPSRQASIASADGAIVSAPGWSRSSSSTALRSSASASISTRRASSDSWASRMTPPRWRAGVDGRRHPLTIGGALVRSVFDRG